MRALVLSATLLLAGHVPAAGQSFDDAARANLALAIEICVRHLPPPLLIEEGFAQAGFRQTERRDHTHGTDFLFIAPAGTLGAKVNAYSCELETPLAPGPATRILAEALNRAAPGVFTMHPSHPSTPCGSFTGTLSDMFLAVHAARPPDFSEGFCSEDGNSRVRFEFPG